MGFWTYLCVYANEGIYKPTKSCVHLTPEVMHHVEVTDLREEASHRLAVVLANADGSGPAERINWD